MRYTYRISANSPELGYVQIDCRAETAAKRVLIRLATKYDRASNGDSRPLLTYARIER